MRLTPPTLEDVLQVREWRNADIDLLRTPFMLTEDMQKDFYANVINNRNSPHRYWSVYDGCELVAFAGLTNIAWENSNAEISLIVSPSRRKDGVGRTALDMMLTEGFNRLNLNMIYGECYTCNPNFDFWERCEPDHRAVLKNRKYCNGQYYDSMYFSFDRRA